MGNGQDYQVGDRPTTGQEFAQFILDMWRDTSELSNAVSEDMIAKREGEQVDSEMLVKFTAKLLTLWKQLCPKIKGNSFKGDETLEADFIKFEKFRTDPKKLIEATTDIEKRENVFILEDVVRRAIEQLGITEWN